MVTYYSFGCSFSQIHPDSHVKDNLTDKLLREINTVGEVGIVLFLHTSGTITATSLHMGRMVEGFEKNAQAPTLEFGTYCVGSWSP